MKLALQRRPPYSKYRSASTKDLHCIPLKSRPKGQTLVVSISSGFIKYFDIAGPGSRGKALEQAEIVGGCEKHVI